VGWFVNPLCPSISINVFTHTMIQTSFAPSFPITCAADVRRLEALQPLNEAVTVRSTYALFGNSAAVFGDKTALTFLASAAPDCLPVHWSYRELFCKIHQTANALHALGVQPTDAVAVLLPGCMEYQLALWGGEAAGIVQPLNPLLSVEKLASLMNVTRAKVLIAWADASDDDAGIVAKTQALRGCVPSLQAVLTVKGGQHASGQAQVGTFEQDFNTTIAAQASDRLISGRDIAPSDIAAYFHTGGTTGSPKLARHSHGAQVFSAWASVKLQGITSSDVTLNGYPLFHVAGVLPVSLASFSAGVQVITPTTQLFRNKAVIANYWQLIERHRVTVLSAVPTILAAVSNVPLRGADITSLRYCRTGAAPLSPELAARFKALFGLHVHESYGMTETAGIATITPPGVTGPAGSVGFAVPYARLRIVALDAQGRATCTPVPQGEHGVVLLQAPNVFAGFLDPADNAAAFVVDGDQTWLNTGDIGWLDTQQRLNLSGRSKDLIIRGGHNIDPKVIEDALSSHPAVQLCAAVGMADAYAGELPVVFVTLRPDFATTEVELLEYVCQRVDEPPARPKWVRILNTMPMTLVGKIYKPDLRIMAISAPLLSPAATPPI
jgi:fatty-acyl-CoA synthase